MGTTIIGNKSFLDSQVVQLPQWEGYTWQVVVDTSKVCVQQSTWQMDMHLLGYMQYRISAPDHACTFFGNVLLPDSSDDGHASKRSGMSVFHFIAWPH